ncbi:GntR family transcriptional regulator [Lampropedia puyangensis]|uniref:GntR family transcriptional regulator n=2 Tax=Lampropedia puyangensis TaxID=1330072 RepID=A0A4S8FBQ3_9BURK|nr:GntR family transcriptional regulator [Lampropedia puyangensis]
MHIKTQARAAVPPSLADQVYTHVKNELFDLALLPGDAFAEADIVAVTGVSRTPVRQALQRLAREGFVQVTSRSGWRVRPFDFERFEQLYDLRIVLELAAVARLCKQPELVQSPAIEALLQAWGVAPHQRLPVGRDAALLDEAFHCTLVEATGNMEMAAVHRDVTEKISIVRRLDFTKQARIDSTYDEHGAILQAILKRREAEACSMLKAHIEVSKAEVRKITIHNLHTTRASYSSRSI